MVFTLHRYIFRELLRVFVLTTVALTLILSVVSPLSMIQKYGVGPEQIISLLGYFLPITLTFVLPMSALFAAALTYGRFASDNEFDACRASGISLATLVYPGLCLGIVVSIATLILSFHTVPTFVQRAEQAVKANAKQILFRNIQKKGYYVISLRNSQYKIYADTARTAEDILQGVVIVKTKAGRAVKLITAETAKILIDTHKTFNDVTVVALNAHQVDEYGDQADMSQLAVSGKFGPLLADNIKFQKIEQIKQIKNNTMNFEPVRKNALEARDQLITEMLAEQINKKIVDEKGPYYELQNPDKIVVFTSMKCVPGGEKTIDLIGPIKLLEFDKITRKKICTRDCDKGLIMLEDEGSGPELELVLDNPRWNTDDMIGTSPKSVIKEIFLPETIAAKINGQDLLTTIRLIGSEQSLLEQAPTDALLQLQEKLQAKITKTLNEITAETHSRLVFGLGCTTLILIGIALGIIYKGGHLLSAFGISSIPAVALIVCIMAGKNMIKNVSTTTQTGTLVMWMGLAVLSTLALVMFRKLLKT